MLNTEQSAYTDGPLEGLYLKYDDAPSDDDKNTVLDSGAKAEVPQRRYYNLDRAKTVRKEFVQAIDAHWSAKFVKNELRW
jgi:hypothetical protein